MTASEKFKQQNRDRLLEQLRSEGGDPEDLHSRAEDLLLAFVDDPEITNAWITASANQDWWYA